MKRYIIWLFTILLILSSFIGCGKKEKNNIIDVTENNIIKEDIKLDSGFFGEWEIAKEIAFSRIYAMDEDDIKEMIGKKVLLSGETANIYGDIISNPVYKQEMVNEDYTWEIGYVNLFQLGIRDVSVVNVNVYDSNNNNESKFTFLMKDENTLITWWDGVFFELRRIGDTSNNTKIIENQSFWHNFENFGNLRFVSSVVNDSHDLPKLKFYLINEARKVLYEFPDFYGNEWPAFWEVRAISFNDVNNDGLTDILVIADYMTGAGENGAIPFLVCGVYFQKDKKFVNDSSLDEELNSEIKDKKISNVVDYLKSKEASKQTSAKVSFDDSNSKNGTWKSTNYNESTGTTLEIKNYTSEKFDFEIEAFLVVSPINVRTGTIRGNAKFNGKNYDFKADYGELTGTISINGDVLTINYIGDTTYYAGVGVQFGTEFKKVENANLEVDISF